MKMILLGLTISGLFSCLAEPQAQEMIYLAPDKAFSFPLPTGSKVERKQMDAATWVTEAISADESLRVTILQVDLKLPEGGPDLMK